MSEAAYAMGYLNFMLSDDVHLIVHAHTKLHVASQEPIRDR